MKAIWLGIVALVIVVALAVGVAAASQSGSSQGVATTSGSYVPTVASHAELYADVAMTQEMATGGHDGHSCAAAMLQRSSNAAYLSALEQHARDVDRMLARTP